MSFVYLVDGAVGPLRALTVSGSVITAFISDEKLVCEGGNSIQDETMDYSVDVGLSVLAARWFAACSLSSCLRSLPRSVRVALPTLLS